MKNRSGEAAVQLAGQLLGGSPAIARALLAGNMDPQALRPMGRNASLRKDEWKLMDDALVAISTQRLVGWSDLVSRGLTYTIGNGLGTTVLEYETESDMNDAVLNMTGDAAGANDALNFEIGYLPLPIIHKDFQIPIRKLHASRRQGVSLDTAQTTTAGRKVSEKIEEILFVGASTYKFGSGTLYGYLDHPSRNTVSLSTGWTASGADPVSDVLSMKQASIDAKHYGPWVLYVPTAYETALDEDFSTAKGDLTIRQRILNIEGIQAVRVADKLTAANVVLVEMQPDTIRGVIGMQPQILEWETVGGLILNYKVMAIMIPQIRADQDGNCGIVHLS